MCVIACLYRAISKKWELKTDILMSCHGKIFLPILFKLGVGPKTEITEISAETETEISAEIDFGHINFSAEIFKPNYSINQDIFDKFNYFKVFSGIEIMFLRLPLS